MEMCLPISNFHSFGYMRNFYLSLQFIKYFDFRALRQFCKRLSRRLT